MSTERTPSKRSLTIILIAALGYFVDIYDLILFSVVRVRSLEALGAPKDQLLSNGLLLINMQMGGMLVGGILWGVLGDKRGRLSVLFGSIALYSVANVLNGWVTNVPQYAALRLVAGIGLAGELGAGITLVSEVMHKEVRGYGTTIVATIGILGAVAAVLVGDLFDWRTAYFVGGGLGVGLLVLRVGAFESGMFESVRKSAVARGRFFDLFSPWPRARKYLAIVGVGVPIWYAVGILVTFSPELGASLGMSELPKTGRAVMWCYIGLSAGDFASGALSQIIKSRRRALFSFLTLTTVSVVLYFTVAPTSLVAFYSVVGLLGFSTGYWAVFVTVASEQFGTNLRATATTTAPNFVRGSLVPVSALFSQLKEPLGVTEAAIAVGVLVLVLAFVSAAALEETFGRDLDFLEKSGDTPAV
ncbi:MAG: MFS transporter [Deltaproteobacteria bacterium]|nr:MFS transporter [Deltaproteobacteria bacterium]